MQKVKLSILRSMINFKEFYIFIGSMSQLIYYVPSMIQLQSGDTGPELIKKNWSLIYYLSGEWCREQLF